MVETGLALSEIRFSYLKKPVLDNLSITFSPGRLTAICGPNGSGKSTLLHVAAMQSRSEQGSVMLNEQNLLQQSTRKRAQALAMLPQTPEAPRELTVGSLVALGRYAYRTPLAGLSPADRAAIDAALTATHLNDLQHRPLSALSGGQRQRAWIAMTLAQETQWMLLDEPTNHLDVAHAIETMELLDTLTKQQGKSVVVVLHDMNLMARFADDVVLMQNGKIVASGPFNSTVTESRLSDIYGRACQFGHIDGRERPFIVMQ